MQLLQQHQHQAPHSPPTKPGRSSNRDSEQKEIDEFEEEERRLLELDQQVREFDGIYSLTFRNFASSVRDLWITKPLINLLFWLHFLPCFDSLRDVAFRMPLKQLLMFHL